MTAPSKIGVKLKAENVDIAYPPIFQSGAPRAVCAACVLCVLRVCCVRAVCVF